MTDSLRPAHAIAPVPDNVLLNSMTLYGGTDEAVAVVGYRGYVNQKAGDEGNKVGIYDDAICLVVRHAPTADAPHGSVTTRTFLGNTDPSRTIEGRAILQPGKYRYVRGMHGITGDHPRPAWVQAGGVTIRRFQADGTLGPELKDQWIGCNIHDGSQTTTGSAGCQTLAPEVWRDFDTALDDALRAAGQHQFWYFLS